MAGFGRLLVRPHPGGTLTWARGSCASVRGQSGSGPGSVAGYPGAPDASEAVFTAGPGSHEFTGPGLTG